LLIFGFCVLGLMALITFTRRNITVGLNVPILIDDFAFTVVSARKEVGKGIPSGRAHYVLMLRIANQASRRDFRFKEQNAVVIDASGREYHVSPEAQRAHESAAGQADPTAKPLPAGTVVLKDLVFDVPRELEKPRLKVMAAGPAANVVERIVFGRREFALP
jgi:hypothetical protein